MYGGMSNSRDGYDEFGLREQTDFIGDAIGIDPYGCGCTDCLVGNSIPLDNEWRMGQLAKAAAAGRQVINRSGQNFALVEALGGTVSFIELPRVHRVLNVFIDE